MGSTALDLQLSKLRIDCGCKGISKRFYWTSGIKKLPWPINYANGLTDIPESGPEFFAGYISELDNPAAAEAKNNWHQNNLQLRCYTALKIRKHNQAIVLKKWLKISQSLEEHFLYCRI